jgi:hypothetical protein
MVDDISVVVLELNMNEQKGLEPAQAVPKTESNSAVFEPFSPITKDTRSSMITVRDPKRQTSIYPTDTNAMAEILRKSTVAY